MSAPTGETHDERLSAVVPVLLRLAHQLTGDAVASLEIVARVLSRRRRGDEPAVDSERHYAGAVVRAARRRGASATQTRLDNLGAATRSCVVLAFGWDWDPSSIAEIQWTTSRRVRRRVMAALALQGAEEWRRLLAEPRWTLPPPDGYLSAARGNARLARRHRRRALLALGSAATAVVGAVVTVNRVAYPPPGPPRTADVAGLLPWAPRGPLVDDRRFVAAVAATWRAERDPPAGEVYVLYAGEVDGRRLAVAQTRDGTGRGRVAVVTDVADRGAPVRLVVRSVAPLLDPSAPAVAVATDPPYPTTSRTDLTYIRLLVAPGVSRVSHRGPVGATAATRPAFATRSVVDGLSEPWPEPEGEGGTAVRLVRADGSTYRGVLFADNSQPRAVRVTAQQPPARWAGLPRKLAPAVLEDDVLWWAQTCGLAEPVVRLVWVGGSPAFPARVRMELVDCPGLGNGAAFFTGTTDGSVLLSSHRGPADVYATEFPGLPSFGLGTLLVVGSADVATVRIGDAVFHHRVIRLPLRESGPIRVFDATGQRLRVR